MASSDQMVNVLEQCRVAPPPGSVGDNSLPLTFFDIPWLNYPVMNILIFYEYSHISKSCFVDTIIPQLKHSLSLALYHFFPLSGNIVIPADGSSTPEIRYRDGDSVSLVFAECRSDFHHLIGPGQRNNADFDPLAAETPPSPTPTNNINNVVPAIAIKVTLFPNSGMCFGFAFHHGAGDAESFFRFVRSWAAINRSDSGDDTATWLKKFLPFYDRTVVKDPIGLRSTLLSNYLRELSHVESTTDQRPPPTDDVVAAFILRGADVRRLKKRALSKIPNPSHVSTYTVICGYVWSCIVKAGVIATGEDVVGENETEHFGFVANCRARLNPPIPPAYFGNCLMGMILTIKRRLLIGEDGFIAGAELIGETIEERCRKKEGIILEGVRRWVSDKKSMNRKRLARILGFPSLEVYNTVDFGWGRPIRYMHLTRGAGNSFSLNASRGGHSFSLNVSRDSEEDFEVGLDLPKAKMDAFSHIFIDGLNPHSSL